MKLLKRTYTLPPQMMEKFERAVGPGERSGVVARLIQDWLDEQERERLRADIAEGCREMWDDYLEMEREWHPLEEEVSRAFPY